MSCHGYPVNYLKESPNEQQTLNFSTYVTAYGCQLLHNDKSNASRDSFLVPKSNAQELTSSRSMTRHFYLEGTMTAQNANFPYLVQRILHCGHLGS
jgi:hypothetical protein